MIGVEEVLDEAESPFQRGCSIAEGPFNGLPKGDLVVLQRDDADAQQALARG